EDYETVHFLDGQAYKAGFIDDVEFNDRQAMTDGLITAQELMLDYHKAIEQGTEDEYLFSTTKMDLTPEAEAAFEVERTKYDKLTKSIADDLRQEKGLRTSNYYHYGITRSTEPSDITAFIRENNITDEGTMSKLYGRLESVKNAESTTMSDDYNPANATDRKAFDAWLPNDPDTTERETFEASLGIAITKNIAPKWLDGYFNRGGYNTDNPQEFAQVAEDYHSYVITTDRVPVTITEETRARFEMYHDLRMARTD
ncbi:unnamed protein product, partial [marine sediment metagenome]